MKLLAVVPSYLPGFRYGGPIRSVHGLARALVERGHAVTVFTTDRDEGTRLDVPLDRPVSVDGVEVRYFEARGPGRLRYAPRMARALAAEVGEFDLVHTHGLFHWPGQAAGRAARAAGVPLVVAPRGMLIRQMLERRGRWRKRLWLELVERENLGAAAALHLTAELEREELPRLGFALPTNFVLPNGVEPFVPADPAGVRADVAALLARHPRTVLFLGRLNWKKGLDRLVAAVSAWPRDVHLIVAGPDDGGEAALRRQVAAAGLGERVTLVGAVSGDTRAALLAGARLLVLPSYSENFGNVVLEAWSAGTPAAVTPAVGAASLVATVGAGFVVEGDGLGPALGAALEREELLRSMGRAGAAAVAGELGWARIAARFEAAVGPLVAVSAAA